MLTYRDMFTKNPGLFPLFPFHADDWNKISYADYTGSYPEQPADSWFVICRYVYLFLYCWSVVFISFFHLPSYLIWVGSVLFIWIFELIIFFQKLVNTFYCILLHCVSLFVGLYINFLIFIFAKPSKNRLQKLYF